MATMDVDSAPTVKFYGPEDKVSLPVLHTIRVQQQQNGLRSYDYGRYRQYCCRRIRRIHKTLRMFAGTSKRYRGLTIGPEDITDPRVLLILVLQTERAWGYAEELKAEVAEKELPRVHRHYRSRMARAEYWAKELLKVGKEVCTEETLREIEGYAHEMEGHNAVAHKEWAKAKKAFLLARKEYLQASMEGVEQRGTVIQRVHEVDQAIRFCMYSLGEDPKTFAGSDQFPATSGSTASSGEMRWHGKTIEVHSEKVKLLLAAADDSLSDVSRLEEQVLGEDVKAGHGVNKLVDAFDKVFIALKDAIQQIKQDITLERGGDPAAQHLLINCLKFRLLEHTLHRNRLLVKVHTMKYDAQESKAALKKDGKGPKQAMPADLARLHDTVVQTIEDMLSIPGVDEDDTAFQRLNVELLVHTALRMLYQAEAFHRMGEHVNAVPLYTAAEQSLSDALLTCKRDVKDAGTRGELEGVVVAAGERVRAAKCISRAVACKRVLGNDESETDVDKRPRHCMKASEVYKPCAQLAPFPPDFECVPCRPILLDIANELLPTISIDHRLPTKKEPSKTTEPQPVEGKDGSAGGWFGGWGWKKN